MLMRLKFAWPFALILFVSPKLPKIRLHPVFVDIFRVLFEKYTKKLLKYLPVQLQPLTFATPIRKLGFDYVSTNQDQITIIRSQPGR
jgi:hypothetical protein